MNGEVYNANTSTTTSTIDLLDLEKYHKKSGSNGKEYDPSAVNWIQGFIQHVGVDRANMLLAGVGQVHYKDEW